jgi:hypothetical protein
MPSTYTTNGGIELPANGEQSGTWGETVNDNMAIIDRLTNGVGEISLSGTTHTLTTTDGTLSDGQYNVLVLGGSPSGTNTITISPNDGEHVYVVKNASGQTATFTQGSGANVSVINNTTKIIYADGAGAGAAVVDITGALDLGSLIIAGTSVTATAAELNLLDGSIAGTVVNSKAVIYGAAGQVEATTVEFDNLSGTGAVSVTNILDEDNMASDSATALATQQSIKAYVDAQVGTVDTLAEILAIGNTTGATDIAVDSAQKVQFRDAAIYINSSVDGQLDIVADTEIQIAATTVDLNGNLDVSGTLGVTGVLTTTAATVSNGGGQFNGAINVGVDDTGYDVKFFGATTGKSLLWDESADSLIVTGTTTLVGTTNLDAVDIDGATQIDATVTVGVDDTGYDVKFFGATAGAYMLWDESADTLEVSGTITVDGLTVDGSVSITDAVNAKLSLSGPISSIDMYDTSSVNSNTRFESHSNGLFIKSLNDDGTATQYIIELNCSNGNIIFFDNTNTEGVHWNAATKRLGIGTVSADTALDVTGTITADGLTVDGATQIDATVTVGVDDTGYDVKFFGATAGAYMLWDESADDLILGGAAGLSVNSTALVTGVLTTTAATVFNGGFAAGGVGTFADGSNSAPSLTNTGDLNTGLYFPAADEVGLTVGGTQRLNVSATGIDVTGTVVADGLTVDGVAIVTGTNLTINSSASTPYIGFSENGTTGLLIGESSIIGAGGGYDIYAAAGQGLTFFTNASRAVDIDTAGNVGIGTSSPTQKLDVAGYGKFTSSDGAPRLYLTGSGVNYFLTNTSTGLFGVYDNTNDAYRLVIDATGNVGIGTAAPESIVHIKDSGNVSTTLQIEGAATGYAPVINFDGIVAGNADYLLGEINGSWDTHTNVVSAIRFESGADTTNKDDGLISFWTSSSGPTLVERMRIDGEGNVVVGGTSAQASDAATLMADGEVTAAGFYFSNNIGSAMNDTGIRRATTSSMVFDTASTERMRIDASGNVGIGVTPTATYGVLQINGPVKISSSVASAAGASAGATAFLANSASVACLELNNQAATGYYAKMITNGASQVGSISYDASATAYNTSSDYRLKTDAQPMTGASARVQALKPVNFEWISSGERVDGFLAHEAQEVVPECVTGTKDAMRDEEYEVTAAVLDADGTVVTEAVMGTRSVPDMQGIDQSKLVPLLTAALQEALIEITALKARVTALEG